MSETVRRDDAPSHLTPLALALADRYRIERELGAGGMATVYLAHDLKHDRKVAVKVLRPELSAILGAQRFLTEIKTTANLQHPHILSLFDSGEADGTVFYVMPYVDGETLRDRIKRDHQLPIDEAVRIGREVLDALEYAHKQGIVHRDIKPENILLHGGHAMVVDFGIALAASRVEGGTRMTETGMSLGTPHYMSPEQAMGEREITPRSDIYALGCVLYEMLTAEPPFVGATAQAIFARVLTDEPRSLTLQRKTVPSHVEASVRRALEKLPADRFATAAEFSAALADPKFATATVAAHATGGRGPTRGLFSVGVGAGIAIGVAALAGAFVMGRGTAPQPSTKPVQFAVTLPDSVSQISRCCGRAIALSPDGSTLVFVGMKSSRGALYRRSMGQLDAVEIPGTVEGTIPFFSPDGSWLGFEADGRLRKVSMAGGPSTPIATAQTVAGASWGDNDVIAYSSQNRIWTVPAAGGTPKPVPGQDTLARFTHPSVLPGGSAALVLFVASGAGPESARIGVMDLVTGAVDTIGYGMRSEYQNGYLVHGAADNTVMVQPFDAARRKTTGQATVLLSTVRIPGGMNHEFALSANNSMTYMPGGIGSTEVLYIAGAGSQTAINLPGRQGDGLEDPAISPDGRRIALRLQAAGTAIRQDVWILDRQQGTLTRFTVTGGSAPVWSRDGKRIAYAVTGGDDTTPGVYTRAADQSGVPQLVLAGAGIWPASWLPGDRGLIISAPQRPSTGWDIGEIVFGDTVPRWLVSSEFEELNPMLSPDGRRLAFVSNRTGRRELYVQSMASGSAPTQVSTVGGLAPRWSRDGRTLFYVEDQALVAATLAPGEGVAVTGRRVVKERGMTDLNNTNVNWDLFPDGKQFLYIDQVGLGAPRLVVIQNWIEMVRAMGARP